MMTAPTRPPLVESYLDRLLEVSGALPTSRRRELLEEVAAHLDDLVASTRGNEAALRNAMERFGTPEDIVRAEGVAPVAAASSQRTVPHRTAPPAGGRGQDGRPTPWGALEIATIALLFAGVTLLPVVGTLAALVCLWLSRQWSQLTKLGVSALVVVPGLVLMVLMPVVRLVLGFQPGLGFGGSFPGLPGVSRLVNSPFFPAGLEGVVLFHGLATVAAVVWLVVSLARRSDSSAPSRA